MNPAVNSGAMGRSRNFGLNHGAGKGDKDRTSNRKAFEQNYDDIDWGRTKPDAYENLPKHLARHFARQFFSADEGDTYIRKGGRLIKRYS